jgi:hypothetical protein
MRCISIQGMPPSMNPGFLSSSIREAQNLAEIQPSSGSRIQPHQHQIHSEAGYQSSQRISPSDLRVLRDKFIGVTLLSAQAAKLGKNKSE